MDWNHFFGFAAVVSFAAAISAWKGVRNGYPFWRTFILSLIGFGGIGLLVIQLLG